MLAKNGIKSGKVKIVMQPAEEIGRGARTLLSTGVIDDIDYLLGLHLMPKELAASGQIVAQIHWTACTLLEAEISGQTAHANTAINGISWRCKFLFFATYTNKTLCRAI